MRGWGERMTSKQIQLKVQHYDKCEKEKIDFKMENKRRAKSYWIRWSRKVLLKRQLFSCVPKYRSEA